MLYNRNKVFLQSTEGGRATAKPDNTMNENQNTAGQTVRKCDVFISYRRDGGDMTAMYFYQALKERGYNVFYDLEVLRAGKFNEALLSSIQSCKDFVLILSPNALDRCEEESDWVRREIAEALRAKKNIIPVMMKGFAFPETMPADIDDVRYQNGLTCTTEYFEESINRLCQRYLDSTPVTKREKQGKSPVAFIAIAAVIVALAVGGFFALRGGRQPKPAEAPAATVEATVEITEAPVPQATPEPTAEPTAQPVAETMAQPAVGQAAEAATLPVNDTDFPVLSHAIDQIDGTQNPGDDNEKSIRENSLVLNHPTLRRRDVASVTFLPSLEDAPEDAWDVSEAGDGRVLAWATPNGELYDLTIAGDGGVKILDADGIPEKMFENYTNATAIRFNGCVDLSQRTIFREMFWGCEALEEIDFTGVCFDNVEDMGYMFSNCHSLKALDTSGWHTSNVRYYEGMFMGCFALEALDLSGLDTASATRMEGMFCNCYSLPRLDLSGFDTRKVTAMRGLFEGCASLEAVDLSGFDTARVNDMTSLFGGCQSLKTVDISGFDTGRVTGMGYMFAECRKLEALDLHGFDTSRVENMERMFMNCVNLAELDVSGWDTGRVREMTSMFEGCHALYSLDLTHFNTAAVTGMHHMFSGCDYAVELLLTGWDVSNVEQMDGMFQGCTTLENIGRDPAAFGHGETTDMYDGCEKLEVTQASTQANSTGAAQAVKDTDFPVLSHIAHETNVPYSDEDEDAAHLIRLDSPVLGNAAIRRRDIASIAFQPSLEGAPGYAWDVSEAGDGRVLAWVTPNGELYDLTIAGDGGVRIEGQDGENHLFSDYSNAVSISLNGCVDLSRMQDLSRMFWDCDSLKQIDLAGICTENATNLSGMFAFCKSLEAIDLSGFDTSKVDSVGGMFLGCESLKRLDLSVLDTSCLTVAEALVAGCSALEEINFGGFDTSRVMDMSYMFSGCRNLKALDVTAFDTGRVTRMDGMFLDCWALEALDVSGFNTSRVNTMESMFSNCDAVRVLDVSGFDTSRVTNMHDLFNNCGEVKALDVSGFDTSRVTDMSGMFCDCSSLETLDLKGFDTSNVENMHGMFWSCQTLDNLDLSAWNTGRVTDMENMFNDCRLLYRLDLSNWDTRSVTNMRHMFANCVYAVEILVTNWDVSSADYMDGMFQFDQTLEDIGRDPAAFGHGDTTDMYDGCEKLIKQ